MDRELSDCLRMATLIKVLPIVASASVQSQHQHADSLHSLCVCRLHVNAVSMTLLTPHLQIWKYEYLSEGVDGPPAFLYLISPIYSI